MSKYIDASLFVEMQLYDDEYEEWGVWNGTIEDLLNQWTEQGCPPTIEVNEDCISREYMLKLPEELKGWMPNDKNQELWEKIKDAPSVTSTKPQKFNRPVTEMLDECGIEWEYSDNPEDIKRTLELFDEAFIEAFGTRPPVTPTEPKPIMTEEVREALMRLSMCAREECAICKYENNCGFDKQAEMATENMNIILNAFNTTPTERTGEWIKNDDFTCSACGYHMIVGGGAYNYCPNCGAKMDKGGDKE